MVVRKCEYCNFTAKTRQNYEVHLKSKKHQDNISKWQGSIDQGLIDVKNPAMNEVLLEFLKPVFRRMESLEHENKKMREEIETLKNQVRILLST